ncbi:MAG: hypothetical protein K2H21_10805, partial [Muribaculaceae bacterium]|nr:hypothetical protein [Muribaculaceae bacterium]
MAVGWMLRGCVIFIVAVMRGLLFFVLLLCGLTATMVGGYGADVNVREPEGCDSCAPVTVQAQVREGVMTGLSQTMVEQGEIEEQVREGLSGVEEQVQQGLSGIEEQVQEGLSGVEE